MTYTDTQAIYIAVGALVAVIIYVFVQNGKESKEEISKRQYIEINELRKQFPEIGEEIGNFAKKGHITKLEYERIKHQCEHIDFERAKVAVINEVTHDA